jgi:hypothetical protein
MVSDQWVIALTCRVEASDLSSACHHLLEKGSLATVELDPPFLPQVLCYQISNILHMRLEAGAVGVLIVVVSILDDERGVEGTLGDDPSDGILLKVDVAKLAGLRLGLRGVSAVLKHWESNLTENRARCHFRRSS